MNYEEYCRIYDAKTNELLTQGQIVGRKSHNPKFHNLKLISLDGKWFFNSESPLFRIEHNFEEVEYVPFTKADDYPWDYWRNWDTPEPLNLYRDFGYDEIDEEVKPLVREMNKWKGVRTVGSCCGHGHGPLWVQFYASDCNALNHLLNVIRSPNVFPDMLDKFTLCFDSAKDNSMVGYEGVFNPIKLVCQDGVFLVLTSIRKDKPAYEDARKLTRYLEEVREMLHLTEIKEE